MGTVLFLSNRNFLDLDSEAQGKCLLCILDDCLDADALLVPDVGSLLVRWICVRNKTELCGALLQLAQLVFSPSRAETSHGILHTDQMQAEHVRRTLHQVHHIGMDGSSCSHIEAEHRSIFIKERCVGIVDVLGCIIALFGFDGASGKSHVSPGAFPYRNHDPTTEDIYEVVIFGVLGHAQFLEQFGGDTFGMSVLDKSVKLRRSVANTVLLKEILIPATGGLLQGFLRILALIIP